MFSEPERVRRLVASRFTGARVLVVGDVMLDCHLRGEVTRISPEAPVPVLRATSRSWSPGGAANVANNLAQLGLQVELIGVTGGDEPGERLRNVLTERGIGSAALVMAPGAATIVKTRVIGGHHQMLRIDDERCDGIDEPVQAAMIKAVESRLDGLGAVVLSDYAKGVCSASLCQAVIQAAKRKGVPVLVDPKGRDYGKYAGATTITPNTAELALATGVDAGDYQALVSAGLAMRDRLGLEFLTFTRGEHGIALIDGTQVHQIPATTREVFDVSGAGDTAIAVLAACLAASDVDLGHVDAVRLANLAAGIVVGKVGTVSVRQDELLASLDSDIGTPLDSKNCSLAQAQMLCARWRAQGERVVFTNGCFDLLHAGHVGLLASARRCGDRLVVGLNSDLSVCALKGPGRPLNNQADRATVLAALAVVDAVVIFGEATPLDLITALRPDVLVKGADYSESQVVGGTQVRSWGGRVVLAPLLPGRSTTSVIKRMNDGTTIGPTSDATSDTTSGTATGATEP